MALEIKIGGTTYRGTTDYSIKQQGGAVSTTSLNVLLETHAVPIVLQVAQVYLDGALFFAGLIQSVSTPEYSSTYETNVFSIDVLSLECLMNHRLVTKNFYYYTYTSWTQVIQYIFDNYISQEGITLGAISTTAATFDSKYSVKDKKVYDVLSEIADAIGNASWWISPDRKFYFKIATDFTSVVAPTHLTKLKLADKIGDIRTVEKMTGASAGITATEINATLLATLAARTGGSGKIEIAESDSDIHSDTKAASEASARLSNYAESEKTITCTCHDLAKSTPYNSWPLSLSINGVAISGDYVVTERTISDHGPDAFSISVTLKNNNYFARYGYSLKRVAILANDATSSLSDIAADNKLTASEKKDELPKWNAVVSEKAGYDSEADGHSVSRVAYDASLQALGTYLNGGTAWVSGDPLWFAGEHFTETTDIDGDTYDAEWQAYYNARSNLETAIRNAIQADAEAAQSAADAAAAIANAASKSWTQSSAPTIGSRPNAINGDTWYDSDDGSKYEAIAGVWVLQTTDVPLDPMAYYSMDEVPEIPDDPAGITYKQDAWATTDSWQYGAGTLSVAGGVLRATRSTGGYIYRTISGGINGKTVRIRARGSKSLSMVLVYFNGSSYVTFKTSAITADWSIIDAYLASGSSDNILYISADWAAGDYIELDFVYIGTGAYLPGSILDNSGHGNHGRAFAVTPVAGISGNGLSFNGISSKIVTPNSAKGSTWSRSLFINIPTIQIGGNPRLWKEGAKDYVYWDYTASGPDSVLSFATHKDASNNIRVSCPRNKIIDGTWHHIVLITVLSPAPGYKELYIDGQLYSHLAGTGDVTSLSDSGGAIFCDGSTNFLKGSLDEHSLFLRALSAQEVLGLYQSKSLPKVYTRAQYLADSAASDGQITPAEKYNILVLWKQIGETTSSGSYGVARARAIALGVSYAALDAAWNALYAYLWTTPGVLIATSWDSNIAASKTTLANLNAAYYAAELAQTNANTTADAKAKIPVYAPKYLGIGILQAASTAAFPGAVVYSNGSITVTGLTVTPNTGDWMTNYDATHLALGIYYWSGSAWTLTESTETKYISSSGYDLLNLRAGGIDIGGVEIITAALISFLATSKQVSTALCSDGITRRMETDWDNAVTYLRDYLQETSAKLEDAAFTSYTGYNQYRRAVRQTASSLEFLDSPVSGTDVVKASIYRQPKGTGSTVLHGDIKAEVTLPYTAVEHQISSTLRNWYGISWSPELGLFCIIAFSSTTCATSPDGINWTEHTISSTSRNWRGISWSPELGLFCIIASGPTTCATSPDGINWTEHTISSTPREWDGISWSPELGLFCIVAYSSTTCATSPDGINWTEHTISSTPRYWYGISWSPELGLFCIIASGSTTCVTSPDGINWTEHTISSTPREWYCISWSPELGLFCIISYNSTFSATSPDGINWTEHTISSTPRYWDGISWSPELGLFCIVAYSSTTCATSPDGINWTEHTISSTSRNWYCISWSPELYSFCITENAKYSALITTMELDKVGTGIIERGSNSNGSYIKFGDGTLICRGWTYLTFAGGNGATRTITFACAFADYPDIFVTNRGFSSSVPSSVIGIGNSGSDRIIVAADTYNISDSRIATRLVGQNPPGVVVTGYEILSWAAIGTWRA